MNSYDKRLKEISKELKDNDLLVLSVIIENVKAIIDKLDKNYIEKIDMDENLYSMPCGTISIEFLNKDKSLCIEVGETKVAYIYYKTVKEINTNIESINSEKIIKEIHQYLQELYEN